MANQKPVYYSPKSGDAFLFIKEVPKTFLIQRIESGTYDYSHFQSLDDAAKEIVTEWWTPGYTAFDEDDEEYEVSYEEAYQKSMDSLTAYTLEEAVEEAFSYNGGFLETLGYIEMVDLEIFE